MMTKAVAGQIGVLIRAAVKHPAEQSGHQRTPAICKSRLKNLRGGVFN